VAKQAPCFNLYRSLEKEKRIQDLENQLQKQEKNLENKWKKIEKEKTKEIRKKINAEMKYQQMLNHFQSKEIKLEEEKKDEDEDSDGDKFNLKLEGEKIQQKKIKCRNIEIAAQDITAKLHHVEEEEEIYEQEEDVEGIRRLGRLAVKYMGKQNGFQGGNLLNLTSAVELSCSAGAGTCTVLGTTRALGMHNRAKEHGVRTTTVYQPTIDYPDLSQAAQITDDSHSPHYKWDRYSAYVRDYTGYMALHVGDTAPPGTAWAFNKDIKLEEVQPESISSSCGITNKMCFWMGCPMVKEADIEEVQREEREEETNCANNLESLVETQEMD